MRELPPPSIPKRVFGHQIETQALAFLVERAEGSWKLLARNYFSHRGEIDLVLEEARPNGRIELVFVEVRMRARAGWVSALESVGAEKRRRLQWTARRFLAAYRGPATSLRFDILGWDGKQWLHVPNAWSVDGPS
ncbi:MAG: YraN family protein [Bacteriovoracia bacterium]